MRLSILTAAACLTFALTNAACTAGGAGSSATSASTTVTTPPGAPYRKVSELVKLPDFLPVPRPTIP